MTNVPIGFGKKEEALKSWSDVKGTSDVSKVKEMSEPADRNIRNSGTNRIKDLEEEFLGKKDSLSRGGSSRGGRGGGSRFNDSNDNNIDKDDPMEGVGGDGFGSFMSSGVNGNMR